MDELVFMNPRKISEEPFTTSAVIADFAGVEHHAVQQLCTKYQADFEEFGKVAFEMRPFPGSKTGQKIKIYHLNEPQATLLITYLKNTPQVRAFKKELVRQFFAMRDKLNTLSGMRSDFPLLTAAIARLYPNPKFYHFVNECDMLNRLITGMSAKQFREAHGLRGVGSIRPYLTLEQVKLVDDLQRADCYLLVTVPDFRARKAALTAYRNRLCAVAALPG